MWTVRHDNCGAEFSADLVQLTYTGRGTEIRVCCPDCKREEVYRWHRLSSGEGSLKCNIQLLGSGSEGSPVVDLEVGRLPKSLP